MSALPSAVLTQNRPTLVLLRPMSDTLSRLDPDGVRDLIARRGPVCVKLTPVGARWALEVITADRTRWLACLRLDGPATFADLDAVSSFVVNTDLPMPPALIADWSDEELRDYACTRERQASSAERDAGWDADRGVDAGEGDDDEPVPAEQVQADTDALHALIAEEIAKRQR